MINMTLKLGFGVTQSHRKQHYSIEHITTLYSSSIVNVNVNVNQKMFNVAKIA